MSRTTKRPNLIHLTLQQLEKLKEYIWSDAETITVAQDVTKLHLNGGKASRTIVVTNGAVYIFKTRSFNKVELDKAFSIVALTKISYIEPNILNLTFDSKVIVLRTNDALNIGNLLTYQYSKVTFHVPNHTGLRVESTPPDALKEFTSILSRPSALFQMRIITFSHLYNKKLQDYNVKAFNNWDQIHSGTFKITSDIKHNGAIQVIAHAISWDEDMKVLDVNGFAPEHLGTFLSIIFQHSFALNKVIIQNYPDKVNDNFDFKVNGNSEINNLCFINIDSKTVVSFFNALKNYTGRIRTLRISKCAFKRNELASIFDSIQNFLCFMKLSNMQIDNLKITGFPLHEFQCLINKLHAFNTLTINNIDIDGTFIMQAICDNAKNIQHVILNNINFDGFKFVKKLVFPESITLLDISESTFNISTFKTIFESILSKPRTSPLIVYSSNLKLNNNITFKDLFNEITALEETYPNIFELCWSDNEMQPDDIKSLISFVKKQTNLKFLDISRSIYPQNKPKESLSYISKYIKESKLEGLSIGSNANQQIPSELISFLKKISGSPNLNSLHLNNSGMQNDGIEIITELTNKCESLQEIDVDGLNISSTNDLVSFYNDLLLNSHLSFISNPKTDLMNLNVDFNKLPSDINKLLKELKKKKLPRTAQERLLQFEQLHVNGDSSLLEEHGLEFLLTLKEPESLIMPKQKKGVIKSRNNALAELNSVMKSMVSVMKGETKEVKYDPVQTAELIMKHLSTSKKALAISENNQ